MNSTLEALRPSSARQAGTRAYPSRSDAHFRRLLAVIRAYLDDLNSGRFIFRPGPGCSVCDYRDDHCRGWAG